MILPKISAIGNIEKTMIFDNSIEKSIALEIHLPTFLPNNLKNRGNDIIKSFSLVLEAKIKINWLAAFFNSNTKIIICMDAVKIGVNIQNIKRVI